MPLRSLRCPTRFVGAEAHSTVFVALRMLGLGADRVVKVEVDDQGRMRPDKLRATLAAAGRADDRLRSGRQREHRGLRPAPADRRWPREVGAWLHVDGAFGLWAAASDRQRSLTDGIELPTPGVPMPTRPSTCPMTAGSCPRQTPKPIAPRWTSRPPTSSAAPTTPTRPTTGSRSRRGPLVGSASTPPFGRSGGSASPNRLTAIARWLAGWRIGWLEPRASRSSTRSASPRSWCASRRPARTPRPPIAGRRPSRRRSSGMGRAGSGPRHGVTSLRPRLDLQRLDDRGGHRSLCRRDPARARAVEVTA